VTKGGWQTLSNASVAFGGALYFVGFGIGVASESWNILGALLVVPVLALLTLLLARRIAVWDREPELAPLIAVAFVAKMVGALGRYFVAYFVYKGSADAASYDIAGRQLAPVFRSGNFGVHVGQVPGTGFIKILAGLVYAIGGTSRLGGFLVFSWIGFMGLILFWRAFCVGVPNGDSRRYVVLVLFFPSLVFWPSSLGKEAWMILTLGLCAYGAARWFERSRTGLGILALGAGLTGTVVVRPHLGLIVFAGLILGFAFNIARRRSILAPVGWIVGLGLLMVVGLILVAQTQSFLGVQSLTQESVSTVLSSTQARTSEGGSAFTPVVVDCPLDVPVAAVTVLFRPLPFDAHSGFVLVTSLEGTFLVGLCLTSRRRLRQIWSESRLAPYVAYSLGYAFAFVIAFSSFSNFGILARERSQLLPALFVLLALPSLGAKAEPAEEYRVHPRAGRRGPSNHLDFELLGDPKDEGRNTPS
jgi:hypothetical protein